MVEWRPVWMAGNGPRTFRKRVRLSGGLRISEHTSTEALPSHSTPRCCSWTGTDSPLKPKACQTSRHPSAMSVVAFATLIHEDIWSKVLQSNDPLDPNSLPSPRQPFQSAPVQHRFSPWMRFEMLGIVQEASHPHYPSRSPFAFRFRRLVNRPKANLQNELHIMLRIY